MGQEAAVGDAGRVSKPPSGGLAAEEAGWLSPLLPRPENKVSVSAYRFLLPQPYSPKGPAPPCLGTQKQEEGSHWSLRHGGGDEDSGYFHSLWARPKEKLCPAVTQQPQDKGTETGGRLRPQPQHRGQGALRGLGRSTPFNREEC